MSAILHRRDCHVAISALDAGLEWANTTADVQAKFLEGAAYAVEDWTKPMQSWPIQCHSIVGEISAEALPKVLMLLRALVDHLEA